MRCSKTINKRKTERVPPRTMKRLTLPLLLTLIGVLVISEMSVFGQTAHPFPAQSRPQYFQPVKICLPEGALQSFAVGTTFVDPIVPGGLVGLRVGSTYRFRIDNIPYNEGRVLYPTIRLLGHLNPPPGKETEFPIIVDLTQEDLELALSGKFVTRIVYLESPTTALPVRSEENRLSREIAPGADPLAVAETLGRPVAVVRIGARVPDETGFFGSPAFRNYEFQVTDLEQGRME